MSQSQSQSQHVTKKSADRHEVAESNGDSIEFSLSNAEQRDSWLNSGHQTLAADNISQMVTYLICDLRKEFFKRVQARFR